MGCDVMAVVTLGPCLYGRCEIMAGVTLGFSSERCDMMAMVTLGL